MPTPTPLPAPVGPVRNGEWEFTIDMGNGQVQTAYYNLQCQADGTILVEGSAADQAYTDAGWSGNSLDFGDTCGTIDTATWCIYYDVSAIDTEHLSGVTTMVANGSQNFNFPTTGRWLGP